MSDTNEMNRRTTLLARASRIRRDLPILKARKAAVKQERSELPALIVDEEALEWESEHTSVEIQARQRHQNPESAAESLDRA